MARGRRDPVKVGGLLVINDSGTNAINLVAALYGGGTAGQGTSYPATITELQVGPSYVAGINPGPNQGTFVNKVLDPGYEIGNTTRGATHMLIDADDAATMVGFHLSGEATISPSSIPQNITLSSPADFWQRSSDRFAAATVGLRAIVRRAGNTQYVLAGLEANRCTPIYLPEEDLLISKVGHVAMGSGFMNTFKFELMSKAKRVLRRGDVVEVIAITRPLPGGNNQDESSETSVPVLVNYEAVYWYKS